MGVLNMNAQYPPASLTIKWCTVKAELDQADHLNEQKPPEVNDPYPGKNLGKTKVDCPEVGHHIVMSELNMCDPHQYNSNYKV
jgi:hypothetical protein